MKRGFTSNITLIIGAIIVFGMVFILGVRFIAGLNENAKQVSMTKFQNKLESDIAAIKTKDSLRSYEYNVPAAIERICFVDSEVDTNALTGYPLIRSQVEGNSRDNVFIYANDGFSSIYLNGVGVYVYPFFACYDIEGHKLILKMQGKANKAMLIPPPDVEMCTIAEDMGKCDWLMVFYEDYKVQCCNDYSKCC